MYKTLLTRKERWFDESKITKTGDKFIACLAYAGVKFYARYCLRC